MSYNFLPGGYIPVLEAASLLAFGDRDYEKHYRLVEVWGEPEMSSENAAEINRRRQEEIKKDKRLGLFYPENYVELDDLGRRKTQELYYPEIKRESNRLQQLAAERKITIIALRRNVPIWDKVECPPLELQYRAIPYEHFKYNEWEFEPTAPFEITKPFNRATKTGGPYAGEWFYPALAESEIEKLRQQAPSHNDSASDEGKYGNDPLGRAIAAVIGLEKIPLVTCQWDEFCDLVRNKGRVPPTARGWNDRTIKRRMGRK